MQVPVVACMAKGDVGITRGGCGKLLLVLMSLQDLAAGKRGEFLCSIWGLHQHSYGAEER